MVLIVLLYVLVLNFCAVCILCTFSVSDSCDCQFGFFPTVPRFLKWDFFSGCAIS